MGDNSNHILINFPHLVLNKIIRYLNHNLDRICFSLTCNKLYRDKDKYLEFILNNTYSDRHTIDEDEIHLKSYLNVVNKSYILKQQDRNLQKVILDEDKNELDINKETKKVCIKGYLKSEGYIKQLFLNISNSNVTSLTIFQYDSAMVMTHLDKIKSLTIKKFNSVELQPGSLPPSLERLELSIYRHTIKPGVLPVNLKYLSFDYYDYVFQENSLPAKLEVLRFNKERQTPLCGSSTPSDVANRILPDSLTEIDGIPSSWLEHIRTLPSIKYINIVNNVGNIDFNHIPKTVEYLIIARSYHLSNHRVYGTLPSGIVKLKLLNDWDESSAELKTMHNNKIETLKLSYINDIPPGLIPSSVRNLNLEVRLGKLVEGVIPDSVKKLKLYQNGEDYSIGLGVFPASVIPASVEELFLDKYYHKLNLPPTLKKLQFDIYFLRSNPLEKLPKSITNFKLSTIEESSIFFRRLDDRHFILLDTDLTFPCGIFSNEQSHYIFDEFCICRHP